MKIAILGTRGIPNHYGGFEQAAENISAGLAKKGHKVTVYNSHRHPYPGKLWNGVEIVHCFDPENFLGATGQFIYDLNCLRHTASQKPDVVLIMGYTSSSIWYRFFPKQAAVIFNMDGMEWKRSKYSRPVQKFLRYAEKLAVQHSSKLIADSLGIRQHLMKRYGVKAEYIAYGAEINNRESPETLLKWQLSPGEYYLVMARMEPENNIDTILKGYLLSESKRKIVVIGNIKNKYGKSLQRKFNDHQNIIFTGPVFDQDQVHTIRKNCFLYFHGHSVGGTNPSLLEAMADKVTIAAHSNIFNKAILENDAYYFSDAEGIANLINSFNPSDAHKMKENNLKKIELNYNWERIVNQYNDLIESLSEQRKNEKIIHHQRYAY